VGLADGHAGFIRLAIPPRRRTRLCGIDITELTILPLACLHDQESDPVGQNLLSDEQFFLIGEQIFITADRMFSTDRQMLDSDHQLLSSGQARTSIAGEILSTDDYPPCHR